MSDIFHLVTHKKALALIHKILARGNNLGSGNDHSPNSLQSASDIQPRDKKNLK